MEDIMLSGVDVTEFVTYFNKLVRQQRLMFARERREEILALRDPEIFAYLCAKGYFCFLSALFETGNEEQTREAFIAFYGRKRHVNLLPSRLDERKVILAVAQRMDLLRFLREETEFFLGDCGHLRALRNIVYTNTSVEGVDYLFGWAIRNNVSVSKLSGLQMFERASASIIRKYISKIGFFSGDYQGISFLHIKLLYDRSDISYDVKMELILFAINHFRVNDGVITKMRKVGMFKG